MMTDATRAMRHKLDSQNNTSANRQHDGPEIANLEQWSFSWAREGRGGGLRGGGRSKIGRSITLHVREKSANRWKGRGHPEFRGGGGGASWLEKMIIV